MDVLQAILGWDDLTLEQRQIVFYVCESGGRTILLGPEIARDIERACKLARVPVPKTYTQEVAQIN